MGFRPIVTPEPVQNEVEPDETTLVLMHEAIERNPEITIGDVLGGVKKSENRKYDFGLVRVWSSDEVERFIAGDAIAANAGSFSSEGVSWVSYTDRTRLVTLLEKYGERLLAFERRRRSRNVTVTVFDVFAHEEATVHVLVQKEAMSSQH